MISFDYCPLVALSTTRARPFIIQGALRAGTNALPFSASARHVYDYLAANASTVQYEYRTSNRRAPYEYCSRILLRGARVRLLGSEREYCTVRVPYE